MLNKYFSWKNVYKKFLYLIDYQKHECLNGGAPVIVGPVNFCLCGIFYRGTFCETFTDYNGANCFPKSSVVETIDKGLIKISELKYGDYVKSYDLYQNKWIYSKFLFYLHQDNQIQAEYILIRTGEKFCGSQSQRNSTLIIYFNLSG